MSSVAVIGGGIAGLSAAHSLSKIKTCCGQKYDISIYEIEHSCGGFARSKEINGVQSEYSWRGFGPWYNNVFSIMQDIGTPYKMLSRPVSFSMPQIEGKSDSSIPRFHTGILDRIIIFWLMLRVIVAGKYRRLDYIRINAMMYIKKYISNKAANALLSVFGPWIGLDVRRASIYHTVMFFYKCIYPNVSHKHEDKQGTWYHGNLDRWLILKDATSKAWFNHWETYFKNNNVKIHNNCEVTKINIDNKHIKSIESSIGEIKADYYIFAVSPFVLHKIVNNSNISNINCVKLAAQEQHIQVSFRLGFKQKINFPQHTMFIIDSPWNITFCPQDILWENYQHNTIKSLWTLTACNAYVPDKHGTRIVDCKSKQEFLTSVIEQIADCEEFNNILFKYNKSLINNTSLVNNIIHQEVWYEWQFNPLDGKHKKWINTTDDIDVSNITPYNNMFLAGAHLQTSVDLWSMEGAAESGIKAASLIDSNIKANVQPVSHILKFIRYLDDKTYKIGLHIIDLMLIVFVNMGIIYALYK